MRHLAIIADGNRRWAAENGLPPAAGHAQGLHTIERCCLWAMERGVPYLTVFCFSTENWGRAQTELDALKGLAREFFREKLDWFRERGIRVRSSGRRDRLPGDLLAILKTLEEGTKGGTALTVIFCVDYGGRDEIARAVAAGAETEEEITAALCAEVPEPDLILRTGRRHRLSNFLLWQGAYAELLFSDTLFPALEAGELDAAAEWFEAQERNYGK